MSQEIEKNYDPKNIETKWYETWLKNNSFVPDRTKTKSFSIVMPPPNVTGKLHMGHALDNTCQDIIVRHKRMLGYNTLWIPGSDHAGISTQAVVEKRIYQEEKLTKHDLGRKKFLERIWAWKEEYEATIKDQLQKIGTSCDWNYHRFTMDETPNRAVRKVFTSLYKQGLIYQAERIINWDTVLQSAISDAEVDYKEVKGKFYHIHYKVKDSEEVLEVATTRPETLFGDTAVAVHPKDKRFSNLIGQMAIIPISGREVPIIGDSYVDMELGTGCLKVTPGHDFNDFEIGKRHELPIINILNKDGTLNENAEAVKGLNAKDARKKTIELLEASEQLVDVKDHKHQVGHGQRSDSIIEPIVSKQWFLNVQEMSKMAVKSVKKGQMNFIPKQWENTFFSWLNEPRDWCLSRQLWWGHRIPVYTCTDCEYVFSAEFEPKQCPKCESVSLDQDPYVLDTWFSSGLWPMSTLGWPNEEEMAKKGFDTYFPNSLLVTGFDIIFFWVARMSMMSLQFTEQAPFKDVYIHGIVRDKQGRKMSKSLGNGIDPIEIIDQYGADAMRFTLASGCGHNRTMNLDPNLIESSRNFINKIWNAFRFCQPFLKQTRKDFQIKTSKLDTVEKWILAELNHTTIEMNKYLSVYRFDEASSIIYSFVYDKYCSWFLELCKPIFYGEDLDAQKQRANILRYVFEHILKLLHPIAPFITEELWSNLHQDKLLISQSYPEENSEYSFDKEREMMNSFIEITTQIRNLRASVQLKPKEEIEVCFFTNKKKIADFIYENRRYLQLLAKVSKGKVYGKDEERPKKSIMGATSEVEIFIPVADLINIDDEVARLNKHIQKAKIDLEKTENKLKNEKFIENAPDEVIAEVKEKTVNFKNRLDSLESNLSNLTS